MHTCTVCLWSLVFVIYGFSLVNSAENNNIVTCSVCEGLGAFLCQHRQTCTHTRCYFAGILHDHNGMIAHRSGCDIHNYCDDAFYGAQILRLECCDSDFCNEYSNPAHVVYTKETPHHSSTTLTPAMMTSTQSTLRPSTTLSTPAVTTSSPPFYINRGLRCEVCSGALCGVFPGQDPVLNCPDPFPYCMNRVENDDNGNKLVSKRCASKYECQQKWKIESSVRPECINFDPSELYTTTFSCSYCCETDECNRDINPNPNTLFIGV